MDSPSSRVDALMEEIRRDVAGWKFVRLKAEGRVDLVEAVEDWAREAEDVLARWER